TWVDGFSEQATADALQRLKDAYAEGLIDMEVTTNKTSSCRDKYYAGQVGAFTYWAGKWSATIDENVKQVNPNGSIVGIAPIKELGQYVERQSPVIAITNKCENPAGVFKYLFEVMVDGDKGQMIFNYGAEGTHYTMDNGKMTQLPDPEVPTSSFTNIFVDPLIGISTWTNGDPMADSRNPLVQTTNDIFMQNSKVAPVIVSNDVKSNYAPTLLDIRTVIVTDVVTGDMTVEEGMASYKEQTSSMVDEILASLN
ncbi:MAG: ABC transporter substrate-binding protein, partial [Candidatus Cellulosilyticum pullistercoris]|nr:ABC transporter substrate-binding protein [Candidatus Cellulosilyticum pullistercoris]